VIRAVRSEAAILGAARALGGGRAVLERTVDHVRTRHQFGVAIGTFQAVQHQLADIATDLDAAGLAVARAAWAVQAGIAAEEVDAAAARAALAATEAFAAATVVAHQLHGGMGFVLDSPLHLWSARAVSDPTAPGTRRSLLDALSASLGLTAHGVRVAEPHRRPA
jgi:alkylation response protein AidB-like acyl-CoA dehydrogenase